MAYRDETEALRHRLERETARADLAEARLAELLGGRERSWSGDVLLFLGRCALIVIPLFFASMLALYFTVGVVFDAFDGTLPLGLLFAAYVAPLVVVGPLAAWRLERPSRWGWMLALFSSLYLLLVLPPAGVLGILLLSRSRVRDAVFGEPAGHPRLRVEAVSDGVRVDASEEHGSSLEGELEPGGPAATETSRSAARVE